MNNDLCLLTTSKLILSEVKNILMAQTTVTRQGIPKPPAYWESIRDRIDVAIAATNLNLMIAGTEQSPQVERTTLFIINKMLPNLQAVAVEITHKSSANLLDLKARADLLGIDESLLMGHTSLLADTSADIDESVIDSTHEEKSIASADSSDTPLPRDVSV